MGALVNLGYWLRVAQLVLGALVDGLAVHPAARPPEPPQAPPRVGGGGA